MFNELGGHDVFLESNLEKVLLFLVFCVSIDVAVKLNVTCLLMNMGSRPNHVF